MPDLIGDARQIWGEDVVKLVEKFANDMSKERDPFWIVYACKEDKPQSAKLGKGVFKQAIKAYASKPPAILGILVWYVNHSTGEFVFCPELSAPPDVPIDASLLSDKASDASARVMQQGEKLKALVS